MKAAAILALWLLAYTAAGCTAIFLAGRLARWIRTRKHGRRLKQRWWAERERGHRRTPLRHPGGAR
jgi:hypothetical protein